MIRVRKSGERGKADHGWLQSNFSFSFDQYYDPENMSFGPLRVMNEDQIEKGMGFGMHPHNDMEIITYLISGQLEHRDSMGNGEVLNRGEVQTMTAGSGIRHSEFNPSSELSTHLIQIWIVPNQVGLAPAYQQKVFSDEMKHNRLQAIASPDGRDDSLPINQDAIIHASLLTEGEAIGYDLTEGRTGWLQLISGRVSVNEVDLGAGDGAAVVKESEIKIIALEDAEFLFFDLV
jgi:redox-sensitive bicupin YhaK (pirin superfamily)